MLRERKCLFDSEAPCLMIGSASWAHAVSQHHAEASLGREPADIDLIMTWDQFQHFFLEYQDFIYQLATTAIPLPPMLEMGQWFTYYNHIKYIARLLDGKVVEIEISDVFPSAQLMQQHKAGGMMLKELEVTNKVPIQMQMCAVAPSTQLALKVSHSTLPVHWRKTAQDIGSMLDYFNQPLSRILPDPASCDPLAAGGSFPLPSLAQLRFQESVAVNYTLFGKTLPCVSKNNPSSLLASFEEMKTLLVSIFGEASLLLSVATPSNNVVSSTSALWTPLLPMEIAADRYAALSAVDKRRLLIEVVVVVCVHYILRSDVMKHYSKRTNEEVATEAYLFALEAVCTRCIPLPEPVLENMTLDLSKPEQWKSNPEFKKWWMQVSVYDMPPATPAEIGVLVQHFSHAIPKQDTELCYSAPTSLEIPTLDAIESMGVAHPVSDLLCSAVVSQLNHLLLVPPMMSSVVGTYFAPASSAVTARMDSDQTVPLEIWKIIVRDYLTDHVSAFQLSRCSKELHKLITNDLEDLEVSQPFWIRILKSSWEYTHLYTPDFFKSFRTGPIEYFKRRWVGVWTQTRSRETYVCPHCGEYHHTMTLEAFQSNMQEHSWSQCPCPQCNDINGSWSGCQYHTVYVKK